MPRSANAQGAVLMTGSMLGFAINDALMKLTFVTLPIGEGMFIRGVFATVLLLAIAAGTGALSFRPTRGEAVLMFVRAAADVVGTITFLISLANLPLATASAVLQAAPLAVTLAAALFLAEPVGWRRWTAIFAGFVGMLVMLRPGSAAFDPMMLMPVATVGAIVVRDIATRKLPHRVPAACAAALTAGLITVSGAALIPFEGYVAPTAADVALYAAAAVTVVAGYLLGVGSMRIGDISAVSPFRYTVLVFALVIGVLMFGHVPDGPTFAGAAIVIAAGLYTLWREVKVSRMRPAARAPVRAFEAE